MPYDSKLADRIRDIAVPLGMVEKKMFGGLGFLLEGNMCVGVWKETLIARVGPEAYEPALKRTGAKEFDITGRPMRGWVMIEAKAVKKEAALQQWIQLAVDFVLTLPPK